ncbi:HGL111Cp [Eremothecium sinecaudum]|uniref:HGL111Cp n=1 Tax=Eremothecium sinecaudum TaxID=45286 RepID=A0A0X8HVE7_9SACH|nr:HGL111Cp [Eremothecium sinecaudum]AMD22229.1 HGL111Cp [Eremothecium sinecaudum]
MFKRLKMATINKICTHSGSFHADEALAVHMLKLLPECKNAEVIRSRDPQKWEEADIVVDVGGKYDGVKFFDHHQREFNETFSNAYKTKLSSAGLVYKHFGKNVIKAVCPEIKPEEVDTIYEEVYKEFIEAFDANDNGISNFDIEELGVKPKFHDKNISIPGIISRMNPNWNEDCSEAKFDEQFFKASAFVGTCFENVVDNYCRAWLPALELVREAVKNRESVDPSGSVILLERFCPWKQHLYQVERELGIQDTIKFVVFKDSAGTWRVSTVPVSSSSFKFRHGLPEPLRGLRDEELSDKSSIPGCIFVHASGFIGGAQTKDAVLQLAKQSLE